MSSSRQRDAGSARSELPDAPEYWRRLEARIREDAAPILAVYRGEAPLDDGRRGLPDRHPPAAAPGWVGVLSRRAPWLVAVPAAAAVALLVTLPPRRPATEPWLEGAVRPAEPVAVILSAPAPPAVSVLLPGFPPAEGVGGEP